MASSSATSRWGQTQRAGLSMTASTVDITPLRSCFNFEVLFALLRRSDEKWSHTYTFDTALPTHCKVLVSYAKAPLLLLPARRVDSAQADERTSIFKQTKEERKAFRANIRSSKINQQLDSFKAAVAAACSATQSAEEQPEGDSCASSSTATDQSPTGVQQFTPSWEVQVISTLKKVRVAIDNATSALLSGIPTEAGEVPETLMPLIKRYQQVLERYMARDVYSKLFKDENAKHAREKLTAGYSARLKLAMPQLQVSWKIGDELTSRMVKVNDRRITMQLLSSAQAITPPLVAHWWHAQDANDPKTHHPAMYTGIHPALFFDGVLLQHMYAPSKYTQPIADYLLRESSLASV